MNISASGVVYVTDLVAKQNIVISATTIQVYKHSSGMILNYKGTLSPNTASHFVSGGAIQVVGTIVQVGPGENLRQYAKKLDPAGQTAFGLELLYNGDVLNYYETLIPPPPPPPPPTPFSTVNFYILPYIDVYSLTREERYKDSRFVHFPLHIYLDSEGM
jgi:hypothetical protein